jgi:dihydroxyacetone kinase-like protein
VAGSEGIGRPRTKKFINDARDVVDEMLDGFVSANDATVRRLPDTRCVVRREAGSGVAVIAGGGSGHEPALLGYVGTGLLDAVVVGDLFASPPAGEVLAAIRATDTGKGVVLLIGNYAGDVMNFRIAARQATAEGHQVATQIVTDDIGAGRFGDERARRGMGGSFFVWKACGAAATSGADLAGVAGVARKTNDRLRTVAVAHTPLTLPGSDRPSFEVAEDEYQFGVGHGEPGVRREPMRPVDDIVDGMVAYLFSPELPAPVGSRAMALVNGLGSVPLMELYVVHRRLQHDLAERGLTVVRGFVGNYYTAVDMAGFSISVLETDDEIERLVLAPARASHFVQ